MLFEVLNDAAERGELILVDGGICHWHLRRDKQITIREIVVLPERRGEGIGRSMLNMLRKVADATSIFAKCPVDLPANSWYEAMGFELEGAETTRTGRKLKLWRLQL
jgi:N-acetylglutamate synthase-like GNAT family acetyltransferase